MNISIAENLDRVFNTQSVFIIQSQFRDKATYPNANQFRVDLNILLNSIADVTLTHYLSNQLAAPSQALYISIDVFDKNRTYLPGYPTQDVTFFVPTGISPLKIVYVSDDKMNDVCIFPKDYKPNIVSMLISIRDDNGILVNNLPEFVMKLFINHYC